LSLISIGCSTIVNSYDLGALYEVAVVVDPATELAQRWAPIIETLASLDTVHLRLYLNPTFGLKDLPIKRFYQYSFQRSLQFDEVTGQEVQPSVRFEGIPEDTLLTFAIDAQQAWLAFPRSGGHDLDNIRLEDLSDAARERGVEAVLELESLVVEGHAREMPSSKPPRGLQLELSKGATAASRASTVE
jgi:UDP-glucose:glycoprotein glucosyltransferase